MSEEVNDQQPTLREVYDDARDMDPQSRQQFLWTDDSIPVHIRANAAGRVGDWDAARRLKLQHLDEATAGPTDDQVPAVPDGEGGHESVPNARREAIREGRIDDSLKLAFGAYETAQESQESDDDHLDQMQQVSRTIKDELGLGGDAA